LFFARILTSPLTGAAPVWRPASRACPSSLGPDEELQHPTMRLRPQTAGPQQEDASRAAAGWARRFGELARGNGAGMLRSRRKPCGARTWQRAGFVPALYVAVEPRQLAGDPRENDSWPATPRKGTLANATVTTGCLCFILLASWLLPRYRAIAGHDATANHRRPSSPLQPETCMPPHGWRLSVVIVSQVGQVVNSVGMMRNAAPPDYSTCPPPDRLSGPRPAKSNPAFLSALVSREFIPTISL